MKIKQKVLWMQKIKGRTSQVRQVIERPGVIVKKTPKGIRIRIRELGTDNFIEKVVKREDLKPADDDTWNRLDLEQQKS